MNTKTSPLGSGDLTSINDGLKKLIEFNIHVGNAKSAGLDTDPFERQAQYYHEQLTQLKQIYFPGK